MTDEPSSPSQGPRPPAFRPPAAAGRPAAGVRVMTAPGASPPAPGSIVRMLVATRGWTLFCAFGLIIAGTLAALFARHQWLAVGLVENVEFEENVEFDAFTALDRGLIYLNIVFTAAFAAGCFYVVPRLLRYAAAISRLRLASRMHELENALRNQRAVWIVFGLLAALWLVLFALQIASIAMTPTESDIPDVDPLVELEGRE